MMHLLHVNMPILDQLRLEEALLRADDRNWCILNSGSPPAIVMGISGKPDQLIHREEAARHNLPIIKRFSGGGTVVVDSDTLFVTFIGNHSLLSTRCFPEPLMRWSAEIYRTALDHPTFALCENDFVIGDRKCGGNAQYIRKDRFCHHTSFLYRYNPNLMATLKHPPRTPNYRLTRSHTDFLTPLVDHLPSSTHLFDSLTAELSRRYTLTPTPLSEAQKLLSLPHRQATTLITD